MASIRSSVRSGSRSRVGSKVPSKVPSKVRVGRSPIHGRGVFAVERIPRGSRIGRFEGVPTEHDGTYVLWIWGDDDEPRGIRGTSALRFLNHACRPNAEFREDVLFALRTIRPGDEITCHYGEAWEDAAALEPDGVGATDIGASVTAVADAEALEARS